MQKPFYIIKADGAHEAFDPGKLERSLELAGVSSTERAKLTQQIYHELKPGMSTEDIYIRAYALLRERERPLAARYSIKRAIFALGPSGFPFEQFIAEILRAHGWKATANVTLAGRCATAHEVDVLAERDGKRVGIEAKFHNQPGGKTDIKDALYVHARYQDLQQSPFADSRVDEGWLVTNTVFTRNAIHYAQCVHLTLLGWDYPHGHGLLQMIEEAGVHPLTCLTTLSEGEKRRLLEKKIVLCKHVTVPQVLRDNGIRPDHIPQVLDEANRLCVL